MTLVNVHRELPALKNILLNNPRIIDETSRDHDLRIGLLNLMPTKPVTEEQFLRLLGDNDYKCQLDFIRIASYKSKNVDEEYLEKFYKDFSEIQTEKYDGFIITGAPVEKLAFDEVKYWEKLKEIFAWIKEKNIPTIYICWGAQAGLYHHYGIDKELYEEKIFGVYDHQIKTSNPLFEGIASTIAIPQSRYTGIDVEKLNKDGKLIAVDINPEIGASIFTSSDNKEIFILGHLEYDTNTLEIEYLRDKDKGLDTKEPLCYYLNGKINNRWKEPAKVFYKNWINFLANNK
ncbi:MAG: homoserine O-succinyltransferase [Gemella sp.]|nr:homoserine O-succinyltransferase [Gemella sp.]